MMSDHLFSASINGSGQKKRVSGTSNKNIMFRYHKSWFFTCPRAKVDAAKRAIPWLDDGNPECNQCSDGKKERSAGMRVGISGAVRGLLGGQSHCWVCGARTCATPGCAEMLVLQDVAAFLNIGMFVLPEVLVVFFPFLPSLHY